MWHWVDRHDRVVLVLSCWFSPKCHAAPGWPVPSCSTTSSTTRKGHRSTGKFTMGASPSAAAESCLVEVGFSLDRAEAGGFAGVLWFSCSLVEEYEGSGTGEEAARGSRCGKSELKKYFHLVGHLWHHWVAVHHEPGSGSWASKQFWCFHWWSGLWVASAAPTFSICKIPQCALRSDTVGI